MSVSESEEEITSTTIKNQLVEINELVVYTYEYSKVGQFLDNLTFNGWDVPLTQKSFLITYDGTLKAGIDFSDVEIAVPQSKILSNIIDEESIEVYDETHNIFNQISINDYKEFATNQKEVVETEAIDNGILDKADERIEDILITYLESLPEIKEKYDINITIIEEEKTDEEE